MSQNQQIYFSLGSTYPIPYEFEADTMQVPRGQYSVLSELAKGNLTNAEAMIYLCLNHGSTWNSGATWSMSDEVFIKSVESRHVTSHMYTRPQQALITKAGLCRLMKIILQEIGIG